MKYSVGVARYPYGGVAPFTGAWIEILINRDIVFPVVDRRTLHGCVD